MTSDHRSSRTATHVPDLQTLRTLASIPAFKTWRQFAMPTRITQWVRTAGRQELMTAIAAGLYRLNRSTARQPKRP